MAGSQRCRCSITSMVSRVVLAGGSVAALWKAELAQAAGAELEVYSEAPCAGLLDLARRRRPCASCARLSTRRFEGRGAGHRRCRDRGGGRGLSAPPRGPLARQPISSTSRRSRISSSARSSTVRRSSSPSPRAASRRSWRRRCGDDRSRDARRDQALGGDGEGWRDR